MIITHKDGRTATLINETPKMYSVKLASGATTRWAKTNCTNSADKILAEIKAKIVASGLYRLTDGYDDAAVMAFESPEHIPCSVEAYNRIEIFADEQFDFIVLGYTGEDSVCGDGEFGYTAQSFLNDYTFPSMDDEVETTASKPTIEGIVEQLKSEERTVEKKIESVEAIETPQETEAAVETPRKSNLELFEIIKKEASELVKAEKAKNKASDKRAAMTIHNASNSQRSRATNRLTDCCMEVQHIKDRLHCALVNAGLTIAEAPEHYEPMEIVQQDGLGHYIYPKYSPPVPDCIKSKFKGETTMTMTCLIRDRRFSDVNIYEPSSWDSEATTDDAKKLGNALLSKFNELLNENIDSSVYCNPATSEILGGADVDYDPSDIYSAWDAANAYVFGNIFDIAGAE